MTRGPDERGLRRRVLRGLRVYFANQRWPRLIMSAILLLTGLCGFLGSYVMLDAGLERMWLRYPLAVLFAWVVFVGLMRLWAETERRLFVRIEQFERLCRGEDPGEARALPQVTTEALCDWVDFAGNFCPDEEGGCLLWILLVVLGPLLLASIIGLCGILLGAPALIAEVFLDACLVAALYRRVRKVDRRWWISGLFQRTYVPVLWTVLTLALAGATMQVLAPNAKSIGGVVKQWRETRGE